MAARPKSRGDLQLIRDAARHELELRQAETISALHERVQAHMQEDVVAFAAIQATLNEIRGDVKSLLGARAMARGLWRATAVIGGVLAAVGAGVAWVVDYLRGIGPLGP